MMASEELTSKQNDLLRQFKGNLKDVMKPGYDDDFLLKWLRAREWDLKKSEKMFRDSLIWRKSYGADTLLDWKVPEVIEKYSTGGYFGHDKNGFPIWYELLGWIDVKGMMFSATKKDLVKNRMRSTEHLYKNLFPEASSKFGKKISRCVFIFDMEGIGIKHMWKPAVDVFTEMLALVEANYPDTLHCAYVIHAPAMFPVLYALVKPFLAPETRSKIRILGSNWKTILLQEIDADQLPVHWGGTATDTDGDVRCKSKICIGGPIPESYRMKNLSENIDMSQFTTIDVNRASTTHVDQVITKARSIIRWNFWTDNNDIAFGVYRRTGDINQKTKDMETIVETSRVNSHMVPESGSIECAVPGAYVLCFDNTYSWLNGKKLSYLIEVLEPDNLNEIKRNDSTNF